MSALSEAPVEFELVARQRQPVEPLRDSAPKWRRSGRQKCDRRAAGRALQREATSRFYPLGPVGSEPVDTPRTIRDEISRRLREEKRRARAPRWIGIVAVVVAVVGITTAVVLDLPERIVLLVGLGMLLVFGIAIAASVRRMVRRITCPVCKATLGAYAFSMEDGPRHNRIDLCPNCGVDLDDPMPEAPTPPDENATTLDKLIWK